MKICVGIVAFSLLLFGCKEASEQAQFLHSATSRANESRYLSKGLVRLTTAYTIDNNQFNSTCSAALIHTPVASLNYCVAVSAAHCFQNIPKNAQHSVEVVDRNGIVIKSYRAAEIYAHPGFVAAEGTQTVEQAANDIALIEFKCSLPNGIQPSKILDVSQLPANAAVTVASHERLPEHKQESENFVSRFLFPDRDKTPEPVARLLLRPLQVMSTDFPIPENKHSEKQLSGVLTLEQNTELTACSGQSGAPAFFADGNEIFLVATASSGQGFCDGKNLRFT
ncbi:MAG: Trypsin, partial [Pseudomonadota bacterium]